MSQTTAIVPAQATNEDIEAVRGLFTALVEGDRDAFAALAHDDIVLRDLNPHGLMTATSRDEALAAVDMFIENFGQSRMRQCDGRAVGHRVQVTYSYGSLREGTRIHHEVHAFAEVSDGRVIVVDEVCSGAIPEAAL
jgi:ketosteroid isomerase-like protein